MSTEEQLLAGLREKIESLVGWGPAEQWTNNDFHTLGERIAETTGTALSASTLKRVWGKVSYRGQPSTTTLDALSEFVGYDNWRAFRAERTESTPPASAAPTPPGSPRRYPVLLVAIGATILLALLLSQSFAVAAPPERPGEAVLLDPDDYHLSFRPVTTGVPNSVVFEYEASKAPTEEVYLQQSWDPTRREQLSRDRNTHTSIYYYPGHFMAKLLVADRVMQERELYLRSDDWVAAVDVEPVPVYLPLAKVRQEGRLAVTESHLTELGLNLQPHPPKTVLVRAGQLEGLWSDDFTFSTRLRHDYATGSAACQYARVLILLKNGAIIFPLSAPGCVADLELYAGGRRISGRDTDLSPFGVVGENWLDLSCSGREGLLDFSINGRRIFQLESEEEAKEIIGVRYEFTGMGSISELRFGNGLGEVWGETFR